MSTPACPPAIPSGTTHITTIQVHLFSNEATGEEGVSLVIPPGQAIGYIQLLGALELAKQTAIKRFGGELIPPEDPSGEE